MNVLEKISFIEKSMGLTNREFLKEFKIKHSTFKKWSEGKIKPAAIDVSLICKEFSLDPTDFISDDSTIDKSNIKGSEHLCKFVGGIEKPNVIFEDFAREDNSRYEEKD